MPALIQAIGFSTDFLGGSVAEGRVDPETGALQCSYHGWKFGPGGGCVDIPQAPSEKAKKTACNRCTLGILIRPCSHMALSIVERACISCSISNSSVGVIHCVLGTFREIKCLDYSISLTLSTFCQTLLSPYPSLPLGLSLVLKLQTSIMFQIPI